MAELHVEPRRRSRAWLWVLLLVLVLAVAAWVLFGAGPVRVGTLDVHRTTETLVATARAMLPAGGFHG